MSNLTGRMVCCITKASPPQVHSLTFFNLIFIYILRGSFVLFNDTLNTFYLRYMASVTSARSHLHELVDR